MKTETLEKYLTTNNTLCPSDLEVGAAVVASDWWAELKEHFDDLIWLYYPDRYVFINQRFSSDDEAANYLNIKKAFAIWIKTKKRLIDRLYVGFMADFNPLWNVDGVEGTISKTAHTGTSTDTHTGTDTLDYEDNGSLMYKGTESDEHRGTDTTEEGRTTFDSGANYLPYNTEGLTHGKTDTHKFTDREDERDYDGFKKTTFDSSLEKENDLLDEHIELNVRQGNIGVTKSTDLVQSSQELYSSELMDLWKWIVRNCVNQVSYSIEGV